MNCIEVNMELEASVQIVTHLLQYQSQETRTDLTNNLNQSFSCFFTSIQVLLPQTLYYNCVYELLKMKSELRHWQFSYHFRNAHCYKRPNGRVLSFLLQDVSLKQRQYFLLEFLLDILQFCTCHLHICRLFLLAVFVVGI